MIPVKARPRFFDRSVLQRRDTGSAIVAVLAVDGLGECVERAEHQTVRVTPFKLDGTGVISGMAEVRPQDVAELRVGAVVLRRGEHGVAQSRVARGKVERECIRLPPLNQADP
jgi:hypothetical protein